MYALALAAASAAFIWWFATGALLLIDRRAERTFARSMTCATLLLPLVLLWMHLSAGGTGAGAAYAGFGAAILFWAWLELSFLLGYITGPRRHACASGCSGPRHFVHAAQAVIHHELALLAGGLLVAACTAQAPNRTALHAYLILFGMRLSAKLNLFLGVPNVGERFLPPHLRYLESFFRRRAMNALMPFSLLAGSVLTVLLTRAQLASTDAFHAASYGLLASLAGLGVLEHALMVLPLRGERLWQRLLGAPLGET